MFGFCDAESLDFCVELSFSSGCNTCHVVYVRPRVCKMRFMFYGCVCSKAPASNLSFRVEIVHFFHFFFCYEHVYSCVLVTLATLVNRRYGSGIIFYFAFAPHVTMKGSGVWTCCLTSTGTVTAALSYPAAFFEAVVLRNSSIFTKREQHLFFFLLFFVLTVPQGYVPRTDTSFHYVLP